MKLRTKMITCMALVFVLFTFALTVALSGMQSAKSRFENFLEQDEVMLQSLTGLYAQGLQMGQALRNIVLDPGNKNAYKNLDDASVEFKKVADRAQALPGLSPAVRQTLQEVAGLRERQSPLQAKIVGLAKDDLAAASLVLTRDETPVWREMRSRLLDLIKVKNADVKAIKADTISATERIMAASLILAALAIVVGIGVAYWLVRNVMRQLGGEPDYAVEIARRIAAGDLTIVIDTKDQGSVLHAMDGMLGSLVTLVSQVHIGTEAIATASREIASGNQDLSARTEHQASSLQQTAASMEELTSTVARNCDNAHHAKTLAESASDVAARGGTVVAQVVDTMGSINASSKKIVDIIGVIDSIAFQTNILALNAAVEAARAGEQGRGFAVVASEVCNLAQRSAAAAREIKTLISDSVAQVDAGTKLVDRAGSTMSDVVASVQNVVGIISDIAAASQEQTSGIAQINVAITQMDEVTQQNAALVEQAAAAAESLQQQSARLVQLVNVFRLDEALLVAPAVAPRKAAARAAVQRPRLGRGA
ncbi:methyl-accepting chemotaxis protein [Oxalobacteraceae bacterium GrIS 1.11]